MKKLLKISNDDKGPLQTNNNDIYVYDIVHFLNPRV